MDELGLVSAGLEEPRNYRLCIQNSLVATRLRGFHGRARPS
jgi:hypothetical protein